MREKLRALYEKSCRLAKHFKKSASISWNASPWLFSFRILIELISVAIPIVSLYLSRNIINVLSNSSYTTQRKEFYLFITLVVLVQLINSLLTRLNGLIGALHNDLVGNKIDLEIIQQINSLDVSYFDNPAFYDQLQNAVKDSRSLQSLTWLSLTMIKSAIQFVSNLIILMRFNIYLPLLMVTLCLPGIFIDKYVAKRKYEWQLQRARNDRKLGYIKSLLQSKHTAKDIRIFGVQEYFKEKFLDMWEIWFHEKKKLEQQKMGLSFTASILPFFATTAVLVFVGHRIFEGTLTLGDYSLYGGISTQLLASITALSGVINQSYESEMRLGKYAEFLTTKSIVQDNGTLDIQSIESLEFKNVSFTYPNTEKQILKDISFSIHKNQSLALVGLNGAGKSTIVKLILRLYDPNSGEIFVNGRNLKEYKLQSYYRCLGVVFQDFNHYNLKIREAVALSDINSLYDDAKVLNACKNADVDFDILKANHGIDTYLGKIFDTDGIELSGGNWQKIAIAQAFFKQSSLMIFDEPNAALDPDAERRLFEKMTKLSHSSCVIYVTHRLSSTTTANTVLVIDNGTCREIGSHTELMEQRGLYYDLFRKQAENYR